MQASEAAVLDVREIPPRDRHSRIFAALAQLAPGGVLNLVVDHDPLPLWYQLQAEQAEHFAWTYLEKGPELWRVRVGRIGHGSVHPEPLMLDNRGFEPPEPLVRTLDALAQLQAGQQLIAVMDREPALLFPQLAGRGFRYDGCAKDDGSYEVRIWRDV